MATFKSWAIPILIALGLLALATRAPLIIAIAKPEKTGVPVECKQGPEAFENALGAAPAPVRLGGVPISECLARRAEAGDVQTVGSALVPVASRLAGPARRSPEGAEATQLGYLIGAVRRGSSSSQGIWVNLRQRIESEALGVEEGSEAFRRGERAGRESG